MAHHRGLVITLVVAVVVAVVGVGVMALSTNDTEGAVLDDVTKDVFAGSRSAQLSDDGETLPGINLPPNCLVTMKNASASEAIALEVTGGEWSDTLAWRAYTDNGTFVNIRLDNYRLRAGGTMRFRGNPHSISIGCTATVRGTFVVDGQRRDNAPWEWKIEAPTNPAKITGSCFGKPADAPLLTVGERLICETKITKQGDPTEAQVTIGVGR
jgi:hypothetical protein